MAAERWNAGDAAGGSDTRTPGSDGAAGQGDRGGHGSDVIAKDAAEFATADRYPCGGWDRGFESLRLLQSASPKPVSAVVIGSGRRRFGRGSRVDLDTAHAERARRMLSGGRIFSGARESADPVHKVHPVVFAAGRPGVRRRRFAGRPLAGGHRGRGAGRRLPSLPGVRQRRTRPDGQLRPAGVRGRQRRRALAHPALRA